MCIRDSGDTATRTYTKDDENYGSLVTNFKYEEPRFVEVSDDDSLADYSYICNDRGVKVYFNGYLKLKGDTVYASAHYLPIYSNGTYEVEGEDMFGNTWTIPVTVTLLADGPKVTMSTCLLYTSVADAVNDGTIEADAETVDLLNQAADVIKEIGEIEQTDFTDEDEALQLVDSMSKIADGLAAVAGVDAE